MRSVVQVKPTNEFKVYVYFTDGAIKLYDMSRFLGHGVFKAISEIEPFMEKCTVINGTLAWDMGGNLDPYNCIDMDPESIYTEGIDVVDPLDEDAA